MVLWRTQVLTIRNIHLYKANYKLTANVLLFYCWHSFKKNISCILKTREKLEPLNEKFWVYRNVNPLTLTTFPEQPLSYNHSSMTEFYSNWALYLDPITERLTCWEVGREAVTFTNWWVSNTRELVDIVERTFDPCSNYGKY